VVGLSDAHYGESVAAFVELAEGHKRCSDDELRQWVQEVLAKHKTPRHIFWLGDDNIGIDFPQTASGKIQKNKLRTVGESILKSRANRAKL
jgi:acyl-coenzyme A synthetase/AMP-(fatty) acid ligase